MAGSTVDLLQEAARMHSQGALADAASRYQEVLQGDPGHAQALYHLAVIACQQGRLDEGIELAQRSLASDPHQPRAQNLSGMALSRLGRQQDALASFERAIAGAPDFAEAHGNRASALMELGRLEEARVDFERAVALQPGSVGDWLNLGTVLHRLGRHEDAIAAYDRVLALHASIPEAHFNRGNVLAHLARYDEALASYDRALAINRRYADALNARARVLLELGRTEGAIANVQEAVALAPDQLGAFGQLVDALMARGEVARALTAIMGALGAKETAAGKTLFVECVKNRKFTADPGGVRGPLLRALSEPWGRPADLAMPAVSLVKVSPAVKECCARAAKIWPERLTIEDVSGRLTAIADDELLRGLLETVPVCDIDVERLLTGLRSILLDAARESPATANEDGLFRFCCALARQCFINEYVFDATGDELERVARLRERLVAAMKSGAAVPPLWVVVVAAYLPLHSLAGADGLLDRSWPPSLNALLTQQVREPLEERRLRSSMPRLTAIADDVSIEVKQQYEENPYPRWVKPAPADAPQTMEQYFGSWFKPHSGLRPHGRTEILVAGCGTGQNLVETARRFNGAEVLAVDLSCASLCYAKRQALALGLTNVSFAEADILELGGIGRSFDMVDSSGVLHHMRDPWTGWRVLLSLLRPGGLMNVGLYSKLARRDITAARAFVAERGYASTAEDIRRSRQDVLALAESEPARQIAVHLDFFATSECRDMFFHVQEHQMTLPEIADFIGENNVEFLGFVTHPAVIHGFRTRFPQDAAAADLSLWQAYEIDHPDIFAGMYQFWVRKIG
jgi:tetratricopeptide (TPR) repeat protein/SAM-dependent methyltransferase